MELTPRQADVLVAIRNHRHHYGHAPTIRELATALSLGRATTVAHVKNMVRKGLLRHTPKKARTLEVVADAQGPAPGEPPPPKRVKKKKEIHVDIPTTGIIM